MSFLEDWKAKTKAGTVATTATMATHTHGSKETQGFSGTGVGGDNWRQVATFQDQGWQNGNCRHVSPTCRQAIQGATSRNTELVANVANVARVGEQKKENRGPAKATHPARVTPGMVTGWRAAREWITARLPELEAAGWTRRELFQAGRLRFPHGAWGMAWLSLWTKAGVEVSITHSGGITFSWIEASGRTVTQTARPTRRG